MHGIGSVSRLFSAADVPKLATTDWGELRAYADIPKQGRLDREKTRRLIHGYYACVSYTDAQIGKVLKELDRLKLRDNTIVVLWGDHGWKLGEYSAWCKHTNFELDTHAPLILSVPGRAVGKSTEALVEFVDIAPTLAELCDLPIPQAWEGLSTVPLLDNPARLWKQGAISQYPRRQNGQSVMGYSLRTDQWRYTEWINRTSKKVVARELYDHRADPIARINLADRPEKKMLVQELSALLDQGRGWKAIRAATQ